MAGFECFQLTKVDIYELVFSDGIKLTKKELDWLQSGVNECLTQSTCSQGPKGKKKKTSTRKQQKWYDYRERKYSESTDIPSSTEATRGKNESKVRFAKCSSVSGMTRNKTWRSGNQSLHNPHMRMPTLPKGAEEENIGVVRFKATERAFMNRYSKRMAPRRCHATARICIPE